MTINGADILNETIIYKIMPFYNFLPFSILCIGFLIALYSIFSEKYGKLAISAGLIISSMIFNIVVSNTSVKTIFNYPYKTQYTIEIIHDEDAWKIIGPNYEVKEKLFENREIYVIEGDYIND